MCGPWEQQDGEKELNPQLPHQKVNKGYPILKKPTQQNQVI